MLVVFCWGLFVLTVVLSVWTFQRMSATGNAKPMFRNIWRTCIVTFAMAALLLALRQHDVSTYVAFFCVANGVYTMSYFLEINPNPILWRHVFVPMLPISLAWFAAVIVMPWMFPDVKHGVPVNTALAVVVTVVSLVCTYTPLGRWLNRYLRIQPRY
jgi:hypothetical protein